MRDKRRSFKFARQLGNSPPPSTTASHIQHDSLKIFGRLDSALDRPRHEKLRQQGEQRPPIPLLFWRDEAQRMARQGKASQGMASAYHKTTSAHHQQGRNENKAERRIPIMPQKTDVYVGPAAKIMHAEKPERCFRTDVQAVPYFTPAGLSKSECERTLRSPHPGPQP